MTNKEIVTGFFKAIDNNDFDTARKLLGNHHKVYSPFSQEPADGDQHIAISKSFNAGFSNASHDWMDVLECGNKVVTRGTWQGIHTGEFNGIPATGKHVQLTNITICEIEDNTIRNQWVEMDSMSLLKQLGVVPDPAHA